MLLLFDRVGLVTLMSIDVSEFVRANRNARFANLQTYRCLQTFSSELQMQLRYTESRKYRLFRFEQFVNSCQTSRCFSFFEKLDQVSTVHLSIDVSRGVLQDQDLSMFDSIEFDSLQWKISAAFGCKSNVTSEESEIGKLRAKIIVQINAIRSLQIWLLTSKNWTEHNCIEIFTKIKFFSTVENKQETSFKMFLLFDRFGQVHPSTDVSQGVLNRGLWIKGVMN